MLSRLAAEKPIAEEPSRWRLYQWSEGVPIMIGTRVVPAAAGGTNLDKTPCRVVIWGMAVPAARNTWTMYLFQDSGEETSSEQCAAAVPLPPGAAAVVGPRGGQFDRGVFGG